MWELVDYGLALAIAYGLGREVRQFKAEMTAATAVLKENLEALRTAHTAQETRLSVVEAVLASALQHRDDDEIEDVVIEVIKDRN